MVKTNQYIKVWTGKYNIMSAKFVPAAAVRRWTYNKKNFYRYNKITNKSNYDTYWILYIINKL